MEKIVVPTVGSRNGTRSGSPSVLMKQTVSNDERSRAA